VSRAALRPVAMAQPDIEMRNMTRPTPAFLAVALLAVSTVAAQEPPPDQAAPTETESASPSETPSFGAQVEQVIVDTVVVDKKGMPVRGLKQDDFEVSEEGVPQKIVSFEAIELPDEPLPEPPPPPPVSVNTGPTEEHGRTFVIVFDDVHMTPWKAAPARVAVATFLREATREGDRVALVSTSGDTWWSARMEEGRDQLIGLVKRLEGRLIPDTSMDRLTDWEALRIHLYNDSMAYTRVLRRFSTYNATFQRHLDNDIIGQESVEDPYITQLAAEGYYRLTARLRTTLTTLQRVVNGVRDVTGRKSVILVSEGFVYDPFQKEFQRLKEDARRANAVIYFVNSRGLEGMPDHLTAEFGGVLDSRDVGMAFVDAVDAVAGAEDVSTSSGGFVVRNTNDLENGIQRIARESQAYYLLGYVSTDPKRDGKFREIKVELKNGKGLKVRARKGYYAPTESGEVPVPTKAGVDPAIQTALDSPWSQNGIPLRMTHYVGDERTPGKAVVLVATEVDVRGFDLAETDGRFQDTLEFLLVVAHRESGEFFRVDQSVVMDMLPETRDRLFRTWYPIVRDFELRQGDYQAKIVVRDKRSGEVGSVVHDFTVGGLQSFRVSTPVISDTLATERPVLGAPGARLAVLARRQFQTGSALYCQIDVFGAEKDPSGMPQVLQGYKVRRADGSVFTSADATEIRPTSLGELSRVSGFSLQGASPGDYELVMDVSDRLSGRNVELKEPFTVVPAS
jgi:VWFA-related protein